MHNLTRVLITILQKYMREPTSSVGRSTTLDEVGIDLMDLSMVSLDVEDVYDVQIGHGDELKQLATVDDLIARVALRLAEKALPRVRIERVRKNWMSTGAERRP
ncbi:MAG TPA: acyl carrier protein [Hyphomicrobium sp.]|jgi:acyl carrier protein